MDDSQKKALWLILFAIVLGTFAAHFGRTQQPILPPIPDPPDFETIRIQGPYLEIIDQGRRRTKLRTKSIVAATHWLPNQHPERRPWDAVDVTMGATKVRIDCKESEDAQKIYDLAFGE